MTRFITAFFLLLSTFTLGNAAVIVSEDFESYADTAAMTAVWGAAGTSGTLDSSLAFSGSNSAAHDGSGTNNYSAGIGTVDATATENVVLSGRIYDDAEVANDRMSIGLRGGPFPLFEMGRYNDFAVGTSGPTDTYGIRQTLFSNAISPGWVAFDDGAGGGVAPTAGWHTYEATFSLSGMTVTLDLGSDGTIDSTISYAGDGNPYGGFTDLRFGSASGVSSAGGGANFDDILLETVPVPEPAGIALILSLVAAALWRRR